MSYVSSERILRCLRCRFPELASSVNYKIWCRIFDPALRRIFTSLPFGNLATYDIERVRKYDTEFCNLHTPNGPQTIEPFVLGTIRGHHGAGAGLAGSRPLANGCAGRGFATSFLAIRHIVWNSPTIRQSDWLRLPNERGCRQASESRTSRSFPYRGNVPG